MAISQLGSLSPEEKKQAILRVSQFVLRESSADVRDSLCRRLLEIGIYISGKSGKSGFREVLGVIRNDFFGARLDDDVAKAYLTKMREEGMINLENEQYTLTRDIRTQLENYSKQALGIVNSCEASFFESIKLKIGEISPLDREKLTECFYQFVTSLISRYVITTAKLLVKGTISRMSPSVGENLVNSEVSRINDARLGEAAKKTFVEWMQSPEDTFVEYLFLMRQNFLCIEILNLDPQCRLVEREEFAKKRLFLDTNIVLSLIGQTEFYTLIKKLIENSRVLGCNVYVTSRTLEELNILLDKAKTTLTTIKATPLQLSKVSNTIIRSYGKALLEGSVSSQTEYMSQFSNMEGLLKDLGVSIFDEEHPEIKEMPGYDGLIRQVGLCFLRMRGKTKSEDVAEHDAYHLLLTKILRGSESASMLGPNEWFLSSDLTLSCAEGYVNKNFSFANRTSAIMVASIWNEITSPFLIGIITQKDLVEVLKSFVSSEFTPISESVDVESLAKLEIDWTEYDWLTIEEIQEITKQKFVLRYMARREELVKKEDTEALGQLRSEFNIAFSRLIGQISSRKIDRIKTGLEEKEKEAKSLRDSVTALEATNGKLGQDLSLERTLTLRMRYIAGASGIVLLAIGIILIIFLKNTATWQLVFAYVASLILGGILLLMSIAPEQVSGWLGLGQKGKVE